MRYFISKSVKAAGKQNRDKKLAGKLYENGGSIV